MGLHFWPLGGLVVGERSERSWNAIAQGKEEREKGREPSEPSKRRKQCEQLVGS